MTTPSAKLSPVLLEWHVLLQCIVFGHCLSFNALLSVPFPF